MSSNSFKDHWENVFETKDTTQVSWYQKEPQLSIRQIQKFSKNTSDAIIDIGGGDSRLPDGLLKLGFSNVSVLDVSNHALQASQKRIGAIAQKINWVYSNVLDFESSLNYDLWFDRAVFHFLSRKEDRVLYKEKLAENLAPNGHAIIAGFSTNEGPLKCSGLEVFQLDQSRMDEVFGDDFELVEQFEDIHKTPSGREQNFYWSVLKRKI